MAWYDPEERVQYRIGCFAGLLLSLFFLYAGYVAIVDQEVLFSKRYRKPDPAAATVVGVIQGMAGLAGLTVTVIYWIRRPK